MRLFLIILLLLTASPAIALEVVFAPQASVTGAEISLGAIARIEAPPAQRDYLAGQVVARAPAPGRAVQLRPDEFWPLLQRSVPQLAQARWSGAETVTVERSGVEISTAQIKDLLEAYLRQQQSRLPQAEIALADLQPVRPFFLPKGHTITEVLPSDPNLLHSRSFNLIFRVDDRVVENMTVRASLQAWAEVYAANADLPRGTLLTEQHLQTVRKDLAQLRSAFVRGEPLAGQQLRRSLRRGDVIEDAMVETPPVVRRGEVVLISVQRGPLALTAQGIAKRDGLLHETILVRNSDSQRDILCRVAGPGQVKVEL